MAEKINDRDFEGTSLPFSNEAEQSVLGAILIDPPSINMILDKLRPEHFIFRRTAAYLRCSAA